MEQMIKVCVFVVFMFCQRLFRSLVLGFEAVTWDVSEGVYLLIKCVNQVLRFGALD